MWDCESPCESGFPMTGRLLGNGQVTENSAAKAGDLARRLVVSGRSRGEPIRFGDQDRQPRAVHVSFLPLSDQIGQTDEICHR